MPLPSSSPGASREGSSNGIDSSAAPFSISAALRTPAGGAGEPLFSHLDAFLTESSPWKALTLWLGLTPGANVSLTREDVAHLLSRDLAAIERLLTRQVNELIHAPQFQKLEASWRGLRYLVDRLPEGQDIKVRVLSVSWKELVRDLERALEFDQSHLFRKIYSDEFGTPGGEPFGVLLGDFEIHPQPTADHPTDDIAALMNLASVAAAAFAPFVTAVHPSFFELDSFGDLERVQNLGRSFEQLGFLKWRAFRHSEDSRFVGLTMPRVLMRLPYRHDGTRDDGFAFVEEVTNPNREAYLWGSAMYAFGGVLIRTFSESGWLADIRGSRPDQASGGMVAELPVPYFRTDKPGIAPRCFVDAIITDHQEKDLADLGFIALCQCQYTELAAFYSNPSIQKVKTYDRQGATNNARLSAMLQYILCVSRIAHYIKVIGREFVGSFTSADDCEMYLQAWLHNYCMGNDQADLEAKARYPLREARAKVRESPEKPGHYFCVIHLRPHFQLDDAIADIRLSTELAPPGKS